MRGNLMQVVMKRINSSGFRWLGFYALVISAWGWLFFMSYASEQRVLERLYGADFWTELCAVDPAAAGFGPIFLMWAVMSAAMMAPTFVPTLRVYDDLTHTEAASGHGFVLLLGGYLAIWLGFSALAAGLQYGLNAAGLMQSDALASGAISAVLLVGAGLYQFSTLKESCLSQCRAPFLFFMQHWAEGPLRNGVRLGLVCIGCCWALMLLGFVGGTMNLIWMGGATLLMVVEKLPEIGRYLTRPLGYLLITGGAVQALTLL